MRLEAGLHRRERVPLAEFMEEVEVAAAIEAKARGVQLTVTPVERPNGDRRGPAARRGAALANLCRTPSSSPGRGTRRPQHGDRLGSGRVLIEVEDECGGLPEGKVEELFHPFEQRGTDRSGVGLGLAIARESVETNGGLIRARNLPGKGCVFTIDLPLSPRESATAPVEVATSGRGEPEQKKDLVEYLKSI